MTALSTILLVEDDHLILLHSAMALEDAGYAVVAAPDAPTALANLAERDDIDALLTDVQLPGGASGIDLAHAAREARPGMPIVVTSGAVTPREGELPEGGRFVAKPYTAAELRRVLARTDCECADGQAAGVTSDGFG